MDLISVFCQKVAFASVLLWIIILPANENIYMINAEQTKEFLNNVIKAQQRL